MATTAINAFAQTQQADDVDVVDEIVIVGTRIQQDPDNSSAPIDVVSVDTAVLQGINDVGELLQTMNVAAGSPQVTPSISSAFVENGGIGLGGRMPVNPDGGGLSSNHPGMRGIFLVIEATRQLRGECGDRQVSDARLALAHGTGGILGVSHSGATLILEGA